MERKRILSWVLSLIMVVSILPSIGFIDASASDNVDAFGMKLDAKLENEDLADNPYGTDGWVNLFTKMELVESRTKRKDDGSGRKQFVYRYGDNNFSSRGQDSNFSQSKGYSIIKNAAFDPFGSGRPEYIANLAYNDGDEKLYLYATDAYGTKGNVLTLESNNEFLQKVETYHNTSHVVLTAGDYDGDGKDSVFVYSPQSLTVKEYSFDGKNFNLGKTINVYDCLTGKDDLNSAIKDRKNNGGKQLDATPSLHMTSGDSDKDGKDELVITANWNDSGDNPDHSSSWINVFSMNDKGLHHDFHYQLSDNGSQDWDYGKRKGRLRFAGSSIGNVSVSNNATDFPEIVTAGWVDQSDNKGCNIDEGKIGVYIFEYSPKSGYAPILKNEKIDVNGFTKGGVYDDDNVQDPIDVVTFAAEGLKSAESIFIKGDVYKYNPSAETKLEFKNRDGYFKDDDNGVGRFIISNGSVQQAIAANFDGNKDGREQVVFTTVQKYKHGSRHFFKTWYYAYNSDGSFKSGNYGWSYYGDGESAVSLTAADLGKKDGSMVKIKSKHIEYSEPEVIAILEAPPYFSELSTDIGNGTTEYGQSKATGSSEKSSTKFSAGVVVGFEYTDPITSSGGGFELEVSNEWTWETTETTETEYEICYSNDTGENAVLMYRAPITVYEYEYYDYSSGKTESDNMTIGVQGVPSTSMITVEDYNKAVESYKTLSPITADMIGEAGNPSSYHRVLPASKNKKNSWEAPGDTKPFSSTGTISQSLTITNSTEQESSYDFSVDFSAYGIGCGFKAGVSIGGGAGSGNVQMDSSGTTKTGAVSGRPDVPNAENYDFRWRFATWTQSLNGEEVPVLGYIVSDIMAPPSPPQNIALSEHSTNSMLLTWEAGERETNQFMIYRYNPNDPVSEYVRVGTAGAGNSEDGIYSYRLKGLYPNTTYQYVVSAADIQGKESAYSDLVIGTTLAENSTPLKIQISEDQTVQIGEKAKFNVTVNDYGTFSRVNYMWQRKGNYGTWQNTDIDTSSITTEEVQAANSGDKYRCIVYGITSDGSAIPFYSDIATISIGQSGAIATLDISNTNSGLGTYANPYIGKSNYSTETTSTEQTEVEKQVTVDVTIASTAYKANVYGIGSEKYIAIATTVDNGGTPTNHYYLVNKTGDIYSAGNKLTVEEPFKKSETAYTWPGTLENNLVNPIEKTTGSETYSIYVPVQSTNESGTITAVASVGEKLYIMDSGKYYEYTDGMTAIPATEFTVPAGMNMMQLFYKNATSATPAKTEYIVSEADSENIWYLITKEVDAYTVEKITRDTVYKNGTEIYATNPDFDQVLKTVTENVDVTKINNFSGTTIKMSVKTFNKNNNTKKEPNKSVRVVISNQRTGVSETKEIKTNSNGEYEFEWCADSEGLYAIYTITDGNTSETQYYFASGEKEKLTYISALKNEIPCNDVVYGDSVELITIESDGANKTEINGVEYTYVLGDDTAKKIESSIFYPPKAGIYSIVASKGGVDLAIFTLTVSKRELVVAPFWDKMEEGIPPVNKNEFTITAIEDTNLAGDDKFDDIFNIECDLYNADGSMNEDKSGTYFVSLKYKTQPSSSNYTDDVVSFINNYDVKIEQRQMLRSVNTNSVEYSAGENCESITGRFGDNADLFISGELVPVGDKVQIDVVPKTDYTVEKWTVIQNGVELSENTDFVLSNDKQRLTIDETKAGKIEITVTFASKSHKITYTYGENGALTAINSEGGIIASKANVNKGASVTFKAEPIEGYVIDKWTVNNATYKWNGTDTDYREKELVVENVNTDYVVHVAFKADEKHTIKTSIYNEAGESQPSLADISAKNIKGEAIDLTKVSDGTTVILSAILNGQTNNRIKEWQSSTDGINFTTIKGSGSKTEITVHSVNSDMFIRAIVTNAQSYNLSYKIMMNGSEVNDENIAKLSAATNNASSVEQGLQPAYISVGFTLTLDNAYYLVSWSDNVTSDGKTATLDSLTDDTDVIVTIAKKPVVNFSSLNGTCTVQGTKNGELETINSGDYVDLDSKVTVNISPEHGYVVKDVKVNENTVSINTDETSDNVSFELLNVAEDQNIVVSYKQLQLYEYGYNVIDTNSDAEGGTFGFISLNVERKNMPSYATEFDKADAIQESSKVYEDGNITLVAKADKDYRVKEWIVDGKVLKYNDVIYTGTTLNITASEISNMTDKTITVQFEYGVPVLTFIQPSNGMLTAETAGSPFSSGGQPKTDVLFTIEPLEFFELKNWFLNGMILNDETGLTYTYTPNDENATVTVELQKIPVNISTVAEENGQVASIPDLIRHGDNITLQAMPNPGYEFEGWYLENAKIENATASYEITAEKDASYIAKFKLKNAMKVEYALNDDSFGKISAKAGNKNIKSTNMVSAGTKVVFTASPNEEYRVKEWSNIPINASISEDKNTLTIEALDDNVNVVCVLEKTPVYQINVNALQNGNVKVTANGVDVTSVVDGTEVTISAMPDTNYMFEAWTGDVSSQTEKEFTLKVDKDITIGATFVPAVYYTVKYKVEDNTTGGTVSGKVSDEIIAIDTEVQHAAGSRIVFTAKPEPGKMIKVWRLKGSVQDTLSNEFVIEKLLEPSLVTVEFEDLVLFDIPTDTTEYTITDITKTPNDYGTERQIRKDGDVSFKVVPKAGKVITALNVENAEVTANNDGTYTVNAKKVNQNIALNITVVNGVPVIITSGENGTVKVTKQVGSDFVEVKTSDAVQVGDVLTIVATPDGGYKKDVIKVNDNIFTSTTYTVKDEDTLIKIDATFKKSSSGSGGGGGGGSSPVKYYAVSFVTNSDIEIEDVKVASGKTVDAPKEITKDGFAFEGWFVDETLTTEFSFDEKITKDITLYAKWKENAKWINPFNDVKDDDWFNPYVEYTNKNNLIKGVENNKFAPDMAVTRGMFVTILYRLEGEPESNHSTFKDVMPKDYYAKAVSWAYENEIVKGVSEMNYAPEDVITREQMAAIILRYAKYKNKGPVGTWAIRLDYKDLADVSEYADEAVMFAKLKNIMTGNENNEFKPQDSATRAETAAVIQRVIENLK